MIFESPKRILIEKVFFLHRPIHRHNEEHMQLFARRTVPVPATRAARREINETRRQLYLQPLQPMLFQRIIDLSSDSSRSYANLCFHVASIDVRVSDRPTQSRNRFHHAKLCSSYTA